MSASITVTIKGKTTEDISDQLLSLQVEHALNEIPTAELMLLNGNFADRRYPAFESPNYDIGQAIEVLVRYETNEESDQSIFTGVVTSRHFKVLEGTPVMMVGMADPAFRLVHAMGTNLYLNKTDKAMIENVLSEQTGLSLKKAAASLSSFTFDQFVRNQQGGWAFIQDRAAAHGLVSNLENGALSILSPSDTSGSLNLEVGIDEILDVNIEENVENQNREIEVTWWNPGKCKAETVKHRNSLAIAGDAKAPLAYYKQFQLTDKKEAEGTLDALVNWQAQNVITGKIQIPGSDNPRVMNKLTLKGLPAAFNGSHTISSVSHHIQDGTWTTAIGFGLELPAYSTEQLIEGLAERSTQIEFATALKWQKDPAGLNRIPVNVPALGSETYWAYVGQVAAGRKQSSFILPEEGEQLMLGFMNSNYNQGVILTSAYFATVHPPSPFKFDAKTPVGLISNSGSKLVINDDKKEVEISTSSSNHVMLNDKSGIDLRSKKNLTTKSSAKTEIVASSTVKVKGTTIDLN